MCDERYGLILGMCQRPKAKRAVSDAIEACIVRTGFAWIGRFAGRFEKVRFEYDKQVMM